MTVHRKNRWWGHRLLREVATGFVDGFRSASRLSDTALSVVVFVVVLLSTWAILSVLTG